MMIKSNVLKIMLVHNVLLLRWAGSGVHVNGYVVIIKVLPSLNSAPLVTSLLAFSTEISYEGLCVEP